jgi:hypothetical protein
VLSNNVDDWMPSAVVIGLKCFGLVWFGLVWFDLIWFGLIWLGSVWWAFLLTLVYGLDQGPERGERPQLARATLVGLSRSHEFI